MKYTILFLKLVVVALLGIIALLGITLGAIIVITGVLDTAIVGDLKSLVLIPIGFFSALCGFVAIDCINYCLNNWEIKT